MRRHLAFVLASIIGAAIADPDWPPRLPSGKPVRSDTSERFLQATAKLNPGVAVAREAPTVDFLYFDAQTYPGNPWSVWGDGLAAGSMFYTSIGDHLAPVGNAYVYAYDSEAKSLRLLTEVRSILKRPDGWYTPGKIHSRLDLGRDGWLYFSTHRGSTRATVPENHFEGGWILRCHPETGEAGVVAAAPLPNQTLPTGHLDPERMIFYAGTADGDREVKRVKFLAYDVEGRKIVYADDFGPYRSLVLARSSGRVYFHREGGNGKVLSLYRFDPQKPGPPERTGAKVGLRAVTHESSQGIVYTVDRDALWAFDTRSETARALGGLVPGRETYIASIDLDPQTERYLYYVPGAHGGGYHDGAPLAQYDLQTGKVKVVAFLHPFYQEAVGFVPMGTYATAVSPEGDKVYITWHGNRGGEERGKLRFNTCALTVVHIPASERPGFTKE